MKPKYVCLSIQFLLILVIFPLAVNAQDTDISLSEILHAVQKNVEFMKEHIIDLVSEEEITIEGYDNKGKITRTTSIISEYRVFPYITNGNTDCTFAFGMLESTQLVGILRDERVILSAKDSGVQRMNRFKFTEPIWAKGHIYAGVFVLFDKQYENCFYYQLKGIEKVDERDAYAIEVMKRVSDIGKSKDMSWDFNYKSVAFIDSGTMEIVQLTMDTVAINDHLTLKDSDWGNTNFIVRYLLDTQYKYDKVKIQDHFFMLPIEKNVKLFRDNGQLFNVYNYRHRNYREFNVNTKITFGATDELLIDDLPEMNELNKTVE